MNELLAYQIIGLIDLSHNLSSEYLSRLNIPVVSVEREDRFISSVNTNNYSGARMAVDLLRRNKCEIYFHVNSSVLPAVPAYGRIQGFSDICSTYHLPNELILRPFTDIMKDPIPVFWISIRRSRLNTLGKERVFLL